MNTKELNSQLVALLPIVIELAYCAGEKIMQVRQQANYNVDKKKDDSPVTAADFAAHDLISEGLNALPQAWPVLSEEDLSITYDTRRQWQTYWLIDPLDGTRDFIAGRETFSVNIALIHNNKPVLGVIQLPVSGECFSACTNQGAWKQLPEQEAFSIGVRVPARTKPVVTISGARQSKVFKDFLSRLGDHELKFIGSSIKTCRVAEGAIDFYPCLGPTSEWDTAAAQCIIEQAGGKLTNVDGKALRYNEHKTLLNPWFIVFGDANHDWLKYIPDNPAP